MKINFQTKEVILTSKQKSRMQKKLTKMKKYFNNSPSQIDVFLSDDSSSEKGGIDQKVQIQTICGKEKIIVEEVDDRLMRAFLFALKRFERQLRRQHKKRIDKTKRGGGGRFDKLWGIVKKVKIKRKKQTK